jgi:hypothetical protein
LLRVRFTAAGVLGLALLLVGCGEEPVRVPNVVGREAEDAAAIVESAKLAVALRPQPVAGDRCTVRSQSKMGEVEPGTKVILVLRCSVEVPDVEELTAADARDKIESAGLSATFEPKPDRPTRCTVERQDEMAYAELGSEVPLRVSCPLTESAANRAAKRYVRRDSRRKKRRYELDACYVVTKDEAECGLTFMRSRRVECSGTIHVKLMGAVAKAKQRDVDCH